MVIVRVSPVVVKHRKDLCQLIAVAHHVVGTGTQGRNLEARTEAEFMTECRLVTCSSSWLAACASPWDLLPGAARSTLDPSKPHHSLATDLPAGQSYVSIFSIMIHLFQISLDLWQIDTNPSSTYTFIKS